MKHTTQRLAYTVADALDSGAFSSRNKFYAAIARGELRTYRDGKRRMVSDEALREYIARRERESEAAA
jgi:excisionase family DNA binding protein